MNIRMYRDEDFAICNKIISDNFKDGKKKCVPKDYISEFVCELNNIVVGYFVLSRISNVVRGYDYYLVDYVCVDKSLQGKGIGTYIMNFIIDKGKRDNVKYIQLTCGEKRECAHHLYEKVGFKKKDTSVYRLVISE